MMEAQVAESHRVNTRLSGKAGRLCLNSEGHVSERDHLRLREKVLRVADLVTADATRPTSPRKHARGLLPRELADEDGEVYLCIRQAFSAAFDELLEQITASEQAVVVEELWTFLSDYLDRTMARADVAINQSAMQHTAMEEMEREMRLLRAHCNNLEAQLTERSLALPTAQLKGYSLPAPSISGAFLATAAAAEIQKQEPQDISEAAGASLLQAKLAELAGRPRGAAAAARFDRAGSAKSAGLRRLAQETGCAGEAAVTYVEDLTPAGQRLSGVYSAVGMGPRVTAVTALQESQQGEQREGIGQSQRKWMDRGELPLPVSAQEHSLKVEREKWQAAQRGLMHKLEEQLVGISLRSSGRLPDIAPAQVPTLDLDPGADMADPVPGGGSPRLSPEPPIARQPPAVASTRPTSIAQRASMSVWGRYLANRSLMLSPTISEAERRGLSLGASLPHLVPPGRLLTDAACGPLAEGLCLSAAQSAASEAPTPVVAGWRATHAGAARQSFPPATRALRTPVLVAADSGELQSGPTSIGRAARDNNQRFLRRPLHTFARGPAASAPEQETLATMLNRSAAAALRPEQIALALAAEPAARPTVSSEIVAAAARSTIAETPVLFTPPAARWSVESKGFERESLAAEDGRTDAKAAAAVPSPPFARDARDTRRSLASPQKAEAVSSACPVEHVSPGASETAEKTTQLPGRPRSSRGFARASMADWGRAPGSAAKGGPSPGIHPRSSPGVSPGSVGGSALVVHSPVWSFDAAGMPTDRSTRPATARDAAIQSPPRLQPALQQKSAAGVASVQRPDKGKHAIGQSEEGRATLADAVRAQGGALDRSISFVCREVTSSLPDLCFAAADAPAPAAAAAQLPADAQAAIAVPIEAGRQDAAAGAKAGKAVTWRSLNATAAAASQQLPPAPTDKAQGASAAPSEQLSPGAERRGADSIAPAVQPLKAAAAVAVAAAQPAVTAAASVVSLAATQAAQAKALATTEVTSAKASIQLEAAAVPALSSTAGALLCTASASSAAVSTREDAGKPANVAWPPAEKDAGSAAGAAVAVEGGRRSEAATDQAIAVAASAAAKASKPAEAQTPFLSAAFSAPLPQSDLAIHWKPAATSGATAFSNPWSAGPSTAAAGWGSQGTPFTPAPSKASIDAETFHTAGDEVSDAGNTPQSSLAHAAGADTDQKEDADEEAGEEEEAESSPADIAGEEKEGSEGEGLEGGKGASLPEKCKSAMQCIKSTCEAVGSMAAVNASAPSSSGSAESAEYVGDDADDDSPDDAGNDSSDDGDSSDDEACAAIGEDSQWESGTSESALESADEADVESEAASGSDEDDGESDGESTSAENPAGDMIAGLLRTVSTELDVDDIMSMTVADLDTRKIKGLAEGSSCSMQAAKVVSLEVFAGPSAAAAAAQISSSDQDDKAVKESEGAEAMVEGSEDESSGVKGTLGNLKCPLPGNFLLPDSLFGSPAAQAAEVDTSFTLRRRPVAKGRKGGRRGRG